MNGPLIVLALLLKFIKKSLDLLLHPLPASGLAGLFEKLVEILYPNRL
jgi:hypothetical protein